MRKHKLLFLLLAFSPSVGLGADSAEIGPFRYTKAIERPASSDEEIVAVEIDSDVYEASRTAGLGDLRIVNAAGNEVPYRLEKWTESEAQVVRRPRASRIVSVAPKENNRIEVVVELTDDRASADGMTFRTPLRDYEREVSVYGSNDGDRWTRLVDGAMIFDYSRYIHFGNRDVKLPKNECRLFKAVIDEVTKERESALTELTRQFRGDTETLRTERTAVVREPLKLDDIDLWGEDTHELAAKDVKTVYPLVDWQVEEDKKDKQTIVHVHAQRQPLTRLTLETTSVNFSRDAEVQVPVERGMTTAWRTLGVATLVVFRFRGIEKVQLAVDFPECRGVKYRIVIANHDNAPLDIAGVTAHGSVYRAVFFAAPDAKYRAYYGGEGATAPYYDTAAISAALKKGITPVAAELGKTARKRRLRPTSHRPRLERVDQQPLGSRRCDRPDGRRPGPAALRRWPAAGKLGDWGLGIGASPQYSRRCTRPCTRPGRPWIRKKPSASVWL